MREILFRGKRVELNDWIEGCVSLYSEPGAVEITYPIIAEDEDFNTYDDFDYAEVIPETVGQYVGLKDRDGKKIFEGDILESPVKRVGQKHGNLILIKDIRECKFAALCVADYIVIGNIYDNPELLEVK